ncbi:hypothetical protein Bbelb_392780 [Branchiostoma belcheri]|nr:hypothetical protein Bbelb_392780 [Branchiostoma belcheri]
MSRLVQRLSQPVFVSREKKSTHEPADRYRARRSQVSAYPRDLSGSEIGPVVGRVIVTSPPATPVCTGPSFPHIYPPTHRHACLQDVVALAIAFANEIGSPSMGPSRWKERGNFAVWAGGNRQVTGPRRPGILAKKGNGSKPRGTQT